MLYLSCRQSFGLVSKAWLEYYQFVWMAGSLIIFLVLTGDVILSGCWRVWVLSIDTEPF